MQRSYGTCPFTEFHDADFHPVVGRAPFHDVKIGAEWFEEGFSCIGDTSTKKNDFGIQSIDQGGYARCKMAYGTKPYLARLFITCQMGID